MTEPAARDDAGPGRGELVDDDRYVRTRRMREQRWLLDQVIRTVGVDWDQGRTQYTAYACGPDAQPDFAGVRERVRKFADIHRVFAQAAARRERLAGAAEAAGRFVEAREHAFIASVLWGNAEWPLFGDSPLVREYGERKIACFELFIRHAPHPVRRVAIPFGAAGDAGHLPGYLHLPRDGSGPFPCVVQIGGMDSFKEHRVSLYGDKYLERGLAQLTVEIPGQGEALSLGHRVTETSAAESAAAIFPWLRQQPEIDPARVAVAGTSFGSFWATQMAATDQDLVGCAVTSVIHQPGMDSIFEQASPTFKARFMYMSGYTDEDAFDRFAGGLDLTPMAGQVRCPYLVLAGEDDELSPLSHTYRLAGQLAGPVTMYVYQGERHNVGGGPASALGPNRHSVVAHWLLDRFAGRPAADELRYVDMTGAVRMLVPAWQGCDGRQ